MQNRNQNPKPKIRVATIPQETWQSLIPPPSVLRFLQKFHCLLIKKCLDALIAMSLKARIVGQLVGRKAFSIIEIQYLHIVVGVVMRKRWTRQGKVRVED